MLNTINIAVSGLNAAEKRLSNSAHNVANVASTGQVVNGRRVEETYAAQDVVQTSLSTGGVTTTLQTRTPGTVPVYAPYHSDANAEGYIEVPNVSLEEEVVQQQLATYDFKANLRSIRAADEMTKSLLDIVS